MADHQSNDKGFPCDNIKVAMTWQLTTTKQNDMKKNVEFFFCKINLSSNQKLSSTYIFQ